MSTGRRVAWLAVGITLLAACSFAGGDGAVTSQLTTSSTTARDVTPSTLPGPLPANGELVRADVPRALSTDVTDAELADLVAGDTEFAFDLFEKATAEGGNVVLSPYSVAAALTMTYVGARGDTAAEMRDVLALGLPDERVHAARNELDLQVTAEPETVAEGDPEPFAIEVANSLWGQAGYPFLDEFLALLAEDYDAGMSLVDFVRDTEAARKAINDWVEDRTAGRIVDLLPVGIVTTMTRLVLVNVIWFKANWMVPFDPDATADGAFTLLDGSQVVVPLMHGSGRHFHAVGDGFQAIVLPYAGDASMLLVVPDEGRFDEVAGGFGPEELAAIGETASAYQMNLTMPKFEFRSETHLNELLQELGMVAAFTAPSGTDGADFTGMVESRELYIAHVMHQAFISVDEQGTEAAAATAVVMAESMAADTPIPITIDRPFLFFIRHDSTGEILFMGQVTDPR